MTTKLMLLKGGKTNIGGGGKRRRRPSRPNPLNELLFHATSFIHYKTRETAVERIAHRMTVLSNRVLGHQVKVSHAMASHLIYDGRKRRLNYGWFLVNVEKGAEGFHRGYVPVLCGIDHNGHEQFLLEESDIPLVIAGIVSATNTEASMLEVTADGMAFAAAAIEASGSNADDMRDLAEDARYLARRMRKLAGQSRAL